MAADNFPLAPDVSRAIAWSYICQDWIRANDEPTAGTEDIMPRPTFVWAEQHCYEELEAEVVRLHDTYKDPVNAYALYNLLGIYKD